MQLKKHLNFVGARKGATGSREDLKTDPPRPKAWVNPALYAKVFERLSTNQAQHSRLKLDAILHGNLFDHASDRYRLAWSKNMITSAGVSSVRMKGQEQLVLHLRDGEDERKEDRRWMRQILENLHKKGGRVQEAVEDFLYLTLVHEASEIHERKNSNTLNPDIKAEIRAEIEEAKAYFSLPPARRKVLMQLYQMLDETCDPRLKVFSKELELFESIGADKLGSLESLLAMIEFVVGAPDYKRESNLYHDERTRLQLARSLFVDILHDFAGSSRFDKWVREIEREDIFAGRPVEYRYTKNAADLSKEAEETLCSAARILKDLTSESADPTIIPSTEKKKRVIDSFNGKIHQLDEIKSKLKLDEVLSIPEELKSTLEDNTLNRHFSYMDELGIYHSLNLSRMDLRGLNLNSGDDERSEVDKQRQVNFHKDERTDLRGAHLACSDISERANFSGAQLNFMIACYSNISEIIFTRTKAIGTVLYGTNANEGQFERANMTAVDARGMSASFARVQMKETDINGMKIWQSDMPNWQRAYVDISKQQTASKDIEASDANRESLKAELDFLDDTFLDELDAVVESETFQAEESWIELKELDGQLDFLKGRGIVFYSREESLEYSVPEQPHVISAEPQEKIA